MSAPITRHGTGKTSKLTIDKAWLEKRYFEDKDSIYYLAKELGIGKRTLAVKFKAFGFKARSVSAARLGSKRIQYRRGSAHEWFKGGTRNHQGYLQVACRDHPDADKEGYVFVHRMMAEVKIGRRLLEGEDVHHIDEDRRNNSLSNLAIMSRSKHMSLHMTKRQKNRRSK